MKTVLLAGGKGTRISNYVYNVPKPLIEISGIPIIEHIMHLYASKNYTDFIVCAGNKQRIIASHFKNLFESREDLHINFRSGEKRSTQKEEKPLFSSWNVSIIDTGNSTMTGGRIARIKSLIEGEDFFVTYSDAVSDVDLDKLLAFHRSHGKIATLTAVYPPQRFGTLGFGENDKVEKFSEKNPSSTMINVGFFVFSKKIFDYIEGDHSVLERDVFSSLSQAGELYAYRHHGFWQCMDLIHEKQYLEWVWNVNKSWNVEKNGLYDQAYHEKA